MDEQLEQINIWAYYCLKDEGEVNFKLDQFRPFEPAINQALENAITNMASNCKYEQIKLIVDKYDMTLAVEGSEMSIKFKSESQ